jgi:2Fe-2S ferredoxin
MPSIRFIDLDGAEHVVEAEEGQSVMQAGVASLVPGLMSECGGSCACASCHAYIDDAWVDRLPPPEELEAGMLTCVAAPRRGSRLTCQITVTAGLDGLLVRLVDNG